MYISCDYYRVFYYVAKYGSVSQAAKLLLNNQPNLTRTIKNLESELGCPLFSRSNRGMKLTPEGERLYAHIRVHSNISKPEKRRSSAAVILSTARCTLLPARSHCTACCFRC